MESLFSYFWSKYSKDEKFRVEQIKEDTMITMFHKDGNFYFAYLIQYNNPSKSSFICQADEKNIRTSTYA